MTICPDCLTNNLDTDIHCIYCGRPLHTLPAPTIELPYNTILNNGKNPYQIIQKIGQGGFGITYRAININTKENIVIKESFPSSNGGRKKNHVQWGSKIAKKDIQKVINDSKQEADVLSKCSHKSIVKYYDCFEENNTCYIVMAFIRGRSMQKLIEEKGRLEETATVKYMTQLAEALKDLHDQGVLHRDIKPDNIMINDAEDRAILIDFGTARDFQQDLTAEHTQLLTPGYAPLEQYGRRQKRTSSIDTYALCASVYHALVGSPPLSALDRFASQTGDPLEMPSQMGVKISKGLEEIIRIGMQMNPKNRFLNAAHLLSYLQNNPIPREIFEARDLIRKDELNQAMRKYVNFLNKDPKNAQANIELALLLIHIDSNRINNAKTYAENALINLPNDSLINSILGFIYCHQGNWQQALQCLQLATVQEPLPIWASFYFVLAMGKMKQWQQAKNKLQVLLQDPEVQQNLEYQIYAFGLSAWVALNLQDWRKTIQDAASSMRIAESLQNANSQISGKLLSHSLICRTIATEKLLGNSVDLLECFNKMSSFVQKNNFIEGIKAWQSIRSGDLDQALILLETKIDYSIDVPWWVYFNLGVIFEKKSNFTKAIEVYEKALFLHSQYPMTLFRLGTLFGKQSRWIKALEMLEKANNLKNDWPEALHTQGWILLEIIKNNILIPGKEPSVVYQEMAGFYRKAEKLYRSRNNFQIADDLKQNLPFL